MRKSILTVVLVMAGCQPQQDPTGEGFQEVPADMVMVAMVQNMTTAGVKRATLRGDTTYLFDDSAKAKVVGVDLVLYTEVGAQRAHLTSQTGDFDTQTQGMVARGNVILIADNRRIETEELHYDPKSHRLWSNVHTVMIEGSNRSTGDGFTADDQFQNVTVKNPRGRVSGLKIEF